MHHDFWHEKWKISEIGFHQESINRYLIDHWSEFDISHNETVFVPLCGKSKDILWLNQKGHPVIGNELSEIACKDFFIESGFNANVHPSTPFTHFSHQDIELLCGDFFNLTAEHLRFVKVVYDRAALIALPPEMRQKYVDHLSTLLNTGSQILLVTMEYPQDVMSGPPFAVNEDEVSKLFASAFEITPLHQVELGSDDPFAKRKGLPWMRECVYKLTKI